MSVPLRWANGAAGALESFEGQALVFTSDVAFAPGAPLRASLPGPSAEPPLVLEAKVRSCRRDGERFRIEARPMNLSNALRDAVAARLGRSAAP